MAEMVRWLERLLLIPLSALIIWRIAPQLPEEPYLIIFLLSELVAVALLLIQRRGTWSVEIYPVAIALIGTAVALLVVPEGTQIAPPWISSVCVLSGAMVSLSAKVFLGRSFGLVPANRGVKQIGIYRLIRHPMYAGYMLNHIGFLLAYFSALNLAIYAIAWTALWLRTVEEEKFLNQDPEYREYAKRVRFKLIPGIA